MGATYTKIMKIRNKKSLRPWWVKALIVNFVKNYYIRELLKTVTSPKPFQNAYLMYL